MAKRYYGKKKKRRSNKYSVAEKRAYWVGYGEGSHYSSEFNHNPNYENPKLVKSAKAGFNKGKKDFFAPTNPKAFDVFGLFGNSLIPKNNKKSR